MNTKLVVLLQEITKEFEGTIITKEALLDIFDKVALRLHREEEQLRLDGDLETRIKEDKERIKQNF